MARTPVIFLALFALACASASPSNQPSAESLGIRFIERTDARNLAPDAFFAREYQRLNARRQHFGFETAGGTRPVKTVGLGLSGGGIRSNAFQMGLLAGLQQTKFGNATLLDRIDYISSVSGGTWANVALWAWPGDTAEMFRCLDAFAAGHSLAAQCKETAGLLRNTQNVTWIPAPFSRQRKERWEADIHENHLRLCDPDLDAPQPAAGCQAAILDQRPYFIVNSTHDAPSDKSKPDNFPLEITRDRLTAIGDRGSSGPGVVPQSGAPAGFSVDLDNSQVQWLRKKFFSGLLPGGKNGLEPGMRLSRVAAHSSAVIQGFGFGRALFLDFFFELSHGGAPVADRRLRQRYVLSDGGKSDNSGIVPLVDRGVDIVVASHLGRDEKNTFQDLNDAIAQVKRLFGCTMAAQSIAHDTIFPGSYRCPSGAAEHPMRHVHPSREAIGPFLEDLERGGPEMHALAEFLRGEMRQKGVDAFPQSKTFQFVYDPRLIRAYYLLGKFIATEQVAPFLRDQLGAAPVVAAGGR